MLKRPFGPRRATEPRCGPNRFMEGPETFSDGHESRRWRETAATPRCPAQASRGCRSPREFPGGSASSAASAGRTTWIRTSKKAAGRTRRTRSSRKRSSAGATPGRRSPNCSLVELKMLSKIDGIVRFAGRSRPCSARGPLKMKILPLLLELAPKWRPSIATSGSRPTSSAPRSGPWLLLHQSQRHRGRRGPRARRRPRLELG